MYHSHDKTTLIDWIGREPVSNYKQSKSQDIGAVRVCLLHHMILSILLMITIYFLNHTWVIDGPVDWNSGIVIKLCSA